MSYVPVIEVWKMYDLLSNNDCWYIFTWLTTIIGLYAIYCTSTDIKWRERYVSLLISMRVTAFKYMFYRDNCRQMVTIIPEENVKVDIFIKCALDKELQIYMKSIWKQKTTGSRKVWNKFDIAFLLKFHTIHLK